MNNSGLQIIKNEEVDSHSRKGIGDSGNKKYLRRFMLFIILFLTFVGGAFFIKDKIEEFKSSTENVNLQKQKLIEQRAIMEKTFKEERDNLLKLQVEFESKNNELNEKLNLIKSKEQELDFELKKIEELKELLKKQLTDIYDLNIDRQYGDESKLPAVSNNSSGAFKDDSGNESIHTSTIVGENPDTFKNYENERVLGLARADWFIKFNSLGEFTY